MVTDLAILKYFASYIEKEIGIVYSESNYFQLEHRLEEISKVLGYSGLKDLWLKAQTGITGQLKDLVLDLATNNETSFFRDSGIFQVLVDHVVPEIQERNRGTSSIRFWSAAGSTGQEACSIAMAMDQAKKKNASFPDYSILVTDISERVLNRAKEGLYSQLEVQRGLGAKYLLEYFEKVGDSSWRVRSKIREKFSFKRLNLLDEFTRSVGLFDVILCRNVLIYQNVPNKMNVVEKILNCLNPQGYLVLGAAESMLGVSNAFKQVQFQKAVLYQKI